MNSILSHLLGIDIFIYQVITAQDMTGLACEMMFSLLCL